MQQGYYSEGNRLFSELVGMVGHIDPHGIHTHVEPITPEELTMANPKNVPPPSETETYGAPTPTYSAPPSSAPVGRGPSAYGAPASQGYQPAPEAYGAPYGAPPQGRGGPMPVPAGRGAPVPRQVTARGIVFLPTQSREVT